MSGDFNITRFSSEHSGESSISSVMKDFLECIFDLDLPVVGGLSTWSNCWGGLRSNIEKITMAPVQE